MKCKKITTGAIILLLTGCRSIESPPPLPDIQPHLFFPPFARPSKPRWPMPRRTLTTRLAVGHLGMVLHAHQQLGSARVCYRRASLLDPRNADWKYYLGCRLRRPGGRRALTRRSSLARLSPCETAAGRGAALSRRFRSRPRRLSRTRSSRRACSGTDVPPQTPRIMRRRSRHFHSTARPCSPSPSITSAPDAATTPTA